jgi:outer membrane protein TolC
LFALAVSWAQEPLTLDDVLGTLDARVPSLEAAEAGLDAARADRLGALGAFDPVLGASTTFVRGYQNYDVTEATVGGHTPIGWKYTAGYLRGVGEVPVYDGERETGLDGELGASVKLPLLQGFLLSKERVALWDTALGLHGAEAVQRWKRAQVRAKAAASWWKWVAYGEVLAMTERRRDLAVSRVDGLRREVETGARAYIDLLDNERALQERYAEVAEAERQLGMVAQELSLWYRDADGRPQVPGRERLIALPSEATPADVEGRRPDLEVAELEVRRAELKHRAARNTLLPELVAGISGAYDLAEGKGEAKFGVSLQLPVSFREGRGKARAAAAAVALKQAKQRELRDRITADVAGAEIALNAAKARATAANVASERAETVRAMEQRRFELGGVDLFRLLQREDVWAKAQLSQIKARLALGLAVVELDLVRGVR